MTTTLFKSDIVSSCCSANVYSPNGEWFQCVDCKEYCDAIDLNEEEADFSGANDNFGYANDR